MRNKTLFNCKVRGMKVLKTLKSKHQTLISRLNMNEYLSSVYYDPKRPGGFGGVNRLYDDVKNAGKFRISRKKIKQWLMEQDTYTLHKPLHRNFKRNRTIMGGIDQFWQMDLADLQSIQKFNDGYRYLLVCIDVFSKYAWVISLKNKTGPSLVEAFKIILSSGLKPEKIMTDQGTKFLNRHFRALKNEEDIELYNAYNETKASIVERLICTLSAKMWRYFTVKKTMRYIDMLPDLVNSYNHSVHRSIKMKPADVSIETKRKYGIVCMTIIMLEKM
ncbi:uncharacterized protein LOC114526613 [Dendronephthya gigantea]|uniref:uncharacterized protein LOC114526613 n=1 Tax=Dendronephthya gigantea TaxID=151771 RepID=UPI00106D3DE1|nr:uncharacterized protein LOC114526613 [Dendronephthya gigantea]